MDLRGLFTPAGIVAVGFGALLFGAMIVFDHLIKANHRKQNREEGFRDNKLPDSFGFDVIEKQPADPDATSSPGDTERE